MRLRIVDAVRTFLALAALGSSIQAAQLVVETPPKEPAEELKALNLPPGFEVQLVAAEPDIHKPINIAFDDRGRLWVTDTIEYPFPAPEGKPTRDTVKILEDFGPDGRARKITTFADNLNIPVGVLPQGDNAALVYSIPGIWRFTDTQGTGKADKRELLLGGYGHDDTHGQTGSFTEGFDGWVYAVHGFRNTSTVKASDGSQITMNSGNTYRFKRDGSHIEYFTHGQVNPFGLCFDPEGNLFSSDCETMPITLLIREGYHPSFGKPDDGLGFTPEVCDHMYGSTAIAGLCDYVAGQFPAEYRGRMFVGNVVTNRINDAKLMPRGSGFHADDVPDFVKTDDGWFRPVNIKLGPDGALYVSDFYNRIIGHYEVDLHHPGRDKQRGRIWRIVYTGKGAAPDRKFDLTHESIGQLIDDLDSANLTVRMLAMNRLADVIGERAIEPLEAALDKSDSASQKVHGLWVLYRLGALGPQRLAAASGDASPLVREHAMRILGEMPKLDESRRQLVLNGMKDQDARVQRLAAEALGRHPSFQNIRALLDMRERAGIDPFLLYTVRIALRDQLLEPGTAEKLAATKLTSQDESALADSAGGAESPDAAAFLLHHIQNTDDSRESMMRYLRLIARFIPQGQVDDLAKFVASKFAADIDTQLVLFKSMQEGLAQRGVAPGAAVQAWGEDLARKLLAEGANNGASWNYQPLPGSRTTPNPWGVLTRASADGNTAAPFLSSNVHGEKLTGVARSADFAIPATLTFYLAGHNGQPPLHLPVKNIVRLRDAQTNQILAEAVPPRNDTAQKVTWNLSKFASRRGYFEATDGDAAAAYAWLAFGRFEPEVIRIPAGGPRLLAAVQIVGSLRLTPLAGEVEKVLSNKGGDSESRVAAAEALGLLGAAAHDQALAGVLRDPAAPPVVREAAANALGSVNSPAMASAFVEAMHAAAQKEQLVLAKALATTPDGAAALLDAVQQGKASPRLLQDPNVMERLRVAKLANLDDRVKQLTQGLPAADAQIQKLIDQKAAAFDAARASPVRGRAVFQKNCIVCHMVGGQGAHVGPQLDGIGVRGVPRLCEDILDPSRNVDAAFRYSTFVLNDGNAVAGIIRSEQGATLTVADSTGKDVTIDKSKISRRVESKLSLMPSNFGEVIPAADFDDLLSYLLSTKQ
jgi:putative heme-binding domain-containing protein